jgi:hypothetical protein
MLNTAASLAQFRLHISLAGTKFLPQDINLGGLTQKFSGNPLGLHQLATCGEHEEHFSKVRQFEQRKTYCSIFHQIDYN